MQSPMVDSINEITNQARQGSVAAIIQLLNETLIMSGVRTRAIFADDVLQILCEANTAEQLEQSSLVTKIQQILESIAPRNIYKVNINCRIVREQQILWLEEINRDPEHQLLWSQEIILAQPSFWQQWQQLIKDILKSEKISAKSTLPKFQSLLSSHGKKKATLKILMISFSGLSLLMIFAWLVNSELNNQSKNSEPSKSVTVSPKSNDLSQDSFAAAVRFANQASVNGKMAVTVTQWLEIAAIWQRASDLMAQVPSTHHRYQEAKIRTKLYKEYSISAEKEAEKLQSKK